MSKLVSEKDYQDIFGESQKKEYERVESISNINPFVINTKIFITEATRFEIKIAVNESNPDLSMGCYDFTMGRKAAIFKIGKHRWTPGLLYNFPEDKDHDWAEIPWNRSSPDGYDGEFPHVIKFGNNYIEDKTSKEASPFRFGPFTEYDRRYYGLREDPRVKRFSTNAPFGLFGIVEYKGDGLPFNYIIPKSDIYSIYYFKVFENDEDEEDRLIADMIPVKDGSGVLCMYDLVRNEFFYPLDQQGHLVNLAKKNGKGILGGILQSLKNAIKSE